MSDERPPIPAELRRRVLVEAGHRCAIPTCRHIDVDVHHIVPWEQCKKHEYANLIALCPNCHSRADKGKIDRKSLHLYKANLRYTHDRFSQFEVDLLFGLYNTGDNAPPNKHIYFPPYMMLLIKRLLDVGYVERVGNKSMRIKFGNMLATPERLIVTEKGREFVESLGIHELYVKKLE